jgi:hypothetical protein
MFYRENLNIKMMRENFVKERILQKIFIAMDKWQAGWLRKVGLVKGGFLVQVQQLLFNPLF